MTTPSQLKTPFPRPHPQVAPLATVAHRAANVGVRAVVNPGFAAGAVRTIAVEALKPLDRCGPIPSHRPLGPRPLIR